MIHLINYENADFEPFSQPVIQSRYDIIEQGFLVLWNVVHKFSKLTTSKRVRLLPWNKTPKRNESLPWCKQEWPDFECPDIPFQDLTPKTKPWLCEAHFYFYPPSDSYFYYRQIVFQTKVLRMPASFRRQFWIAPPDKIYGKDVWSGNWRTVTSTRHDILVYENVAKVQSWLTALSLPPLGIQETAQSHLQLLLAYAKTEFKNRWISKITDNWQWTLLCRYCHPNELPFSAIYLGTPTNRNSFLEHISLLTNSMDNIIHLIFALGRPPSSSLHTKVDTLPELKDINEVHQFLNNPELSVDEARWELETRVLGSVFKNITFASHLYQVVGLTDRFKKRQNGQAHAPMLVVLPNGRLDQLPYSFHEQALKFVSCGEPNLENIDFLLITSVYDSATWLAIGITLLTISCFTTVCIEFKGKNLKISRWKNLSYKFISSSLSYFAPLVEDSDSISQKIFKNTGFRCLLGAYFITVVILSNAFKYKNISDLTMPLARIPYDTYESLVSNNFSIYTRSVYFGGWANLKNLVSEGNLFGVWATSSVSILHYVDKSMDLVVSEIQSFVHSQEQIRNLWMTTTDFSLEHQRLINSTKLLPFGFKLLDGKDESCTLFGKNSTCNILKDCNKTALLLPDVDANLKYLETVEGNEDKVFLSKNSSVKIKFGLQFFDWVHPRILKRLAGLQESYIMEWWTNFMVEFVPKIKTKHLRTEHTFRSTSIHGKIFTIFVLWAGGISICVAVYCLENCSMERFRIVRNELILYKKIAVKIAKQIHFYVFKSRYETKKAVMGKNESSVSLNVVSA